MPLMPDAPIKAPDFCLPNQNNKQVCLADLLKEGWRYIVVYFYPKDMTPGCTIEAVSFSKHLDQFLKLKTKVVGISKLGVESKQKFAQKYRLKLDLLADEDLSVARAYGVLKEKKLFGKSRVGINRETFLIDGQTGKIIHHWPKVQAKAHVVEVLDFVRQLSVKS